MPMNLTLFLSPALTAGALSFYPLPPWLVRPLLQMSPTGAHVNDVTDVLTVGQVVDVRIREVHTFVVYFRSMFFFA